MTISAYVTTSKLKRSLYEGPLSGIHIDLYAAQLLKEGHCRQSAWRCLRVISHFGHWLGRKRISLAEVDERTVERYQEFRSRNRCPFSSDQPALNRLLTVLRGVDAIQPKCPAAFGVILSSSSFGATWLRNAGLPVEPLPVTNLLFGVSSGSDARTIRRDFER